MKNFDIARDFGINRRVLHSYQAWKEAAGLLSLIHMQRQEVAQAAGSMGGTSYDNNNEHSGASWGQRGG